MNVLMAVRTPTQLMNAMVLSRTYYAQDEIDVFYGPRVRQYIALVENKAYFRKCIESNPLRRSGKRGRLGKIFSPFLMRAAMRDLIRSFPTDPRQYHTVLISGITFSAFLYYYGLKTVNPAVELNLYEEGICEYYTLGYKRFWRRLYSRAMFGRYHYEDCRKLFVYQPEMVKNAWDHIEIKRMTPPQALAGVAADISLIYDYKSGTLEGKRQRFIFLDQTFAGLRDEKELDRQQTEILRRIGEIVGKENLLVKLHPASAPDKYGGDYSCLQTRIPFEIVAMNEALEERVFITVSSSVVVNFKLILNQEPYIIVLKNMIQSKPGPAAKYVDELFESVRKSCKEGRFAMPRTLDELTEHLKNLSKSTAEINDGKQ